MSDVKSLDFLNARPDSTRSVRVRIITIDNTVEFVLPIDTEIPDFRLETKANSGTFILVNRPGSETTLPIFNGANYQIFDRDNSQIIEMVAILSCLPLRKKRIVD